MSTTEQSVSGAVKACSVSIDMRKVLTSCLARAWPATGEVLDAILHHGRKGVTGTHYNFALYEKQVRKALQLWAHHIEAIVAGRKEDADDNVISKTAARA
jgi:hypothetical protein